MGIRLTAALALLASVCLGACAGTVTAPIPPQRQLQDVTRPGEVFALEVYDPIERWNRGVYTFNARADRTVILPIVNAYRFVTPEFVRNRIQRLLLEPDRDPDLRQCGAAAQARYCRAGGAPVHQQRPARRRRPLRHRGRDGRVPQVTEDFGQTLGHWGVGDGPYLVLPLLGPSNLRDASGLAVDSVGFSLLIPPGIRSSAAYLGTAYGLRPIDLRSNIPFRYYRTGSPFEYDLIRLVYTRTREFQIAK